MTYVVTEACIKCKYTDCVEVCPVDCFYEGENMLVIHPDECIDCGVCEPECPADAIKPDTEPCLRPRLGIGPYRVDRASWVAEPAVDALVGVNNEHVLAFIEAIDGADLHAIGVFALYAFFVDDVGHYRIRLA